MTIGGRSINELPPHLRGLNKGILEPHMIGSTLGLHDAEMKQIQLKWKIHLSFY